MFQGMEYVYEVYKERSFSKAARNLFISQPSLSASVKRVEQEIGYPVFDRSTKPLGLTEPGEAYIRSIERILSVEHEFSSFLNDWGDLKTGRLVLGASSLFSSWVLPAPMGEFVRRYPQVELVLVEESTGKLQELLLSGGVDLIMDNCSLPEEIFDRRLLRKEHLLLAAPLELIRSRHPNLLPLQLTPEQIKSGDYLLEDVSAVPLIELKEEPFLLLKPDNDTRIRAMKICQAAGFAPKILFELDQQLTSYNITSSGMGLSFIGDMMAGKVPENPNVVYFKLPEEASRRGLYFYWKKGRYLSRAMEEFLRMACGSL